jgi:hypothetical protein
MGKFFRLLKKYDDIDVYIDKLNQIEAGDLPQIKSTNEVSQLDDSNSSIQSDNTNKQSQTDTSLKQPQSGESDDCTGLFTQDPSK